MKLAIVAAALTTWTLVSVAHGQDSKPVTPGQPAQPPAQPSGKPGEKTDGKQLSQDNLPAAEALFEKHIAAIGGLEAMKAERNRLVRAKFTLPGGSSDGSLRVIRIAPNKMSQVLEIPGVITQEVWYNGEDAWKRDTNAGTRRLQGDELAETKMQADILGECNFKARYREVKTVARETFAGVEAYSVKAVTPEGKERTLYFDAKAGFLIGLKAPSQTTGMESLVTMSDYKKFGETMHPTKSVMTIGASEIGTITITQVESNLSVPPTVNPPDEVRAVK
jgi:hypothetical protein